MAKQNLRPVVVSALGFAFVASWLFKWRGFIGVNGQWGEEPNDTPWPLAAWPLPLGVLVIFGGAAALSVYDRYKRAKNPKEQRNSIFTALVALVIINLTLPWALLGPGSIPRPVIPGQPVKMTLEGRVNIIAALWSDVATEYFGTAYQIEDVRQFSREYADKWQNPGFTSLAHVATHPPGAVIFFYGIRRATERIPALGNGMNSFAASITRMPFHELYSFVGAMRMTASRSAGVKAPTNLPPDAVGAALLSAILLNAALAAAIPAVFGLAALNAPDEATGDARGLLAAGLFILAPSLNLFAFTLDALVASGVIWTLYALAKGLNGGSKRWLWLSGAMFALTSFVSIGVLAVGVIVLLLTVWTRRANGQSPLPKAELGNWAAGFLAALVLLWLLFPFNPPAVLLNAMAAHRFATLQYRSWMPWFWINFVLFAIFTGWPILTSTFECLVAFVRKQEKAFPALQVAALTVLTILLLSFSGNVRGEVERLWLFLLAPLTVAALPRPDWRASAALLVLQAGQTLCMAATLAPLVRPF